MSTAAHLTTPAKQSDVIGGFEGSPTSTFSSSTTTSNHDLSTLQSFRNAMGSVHLSPAMMQQHPQRQLYVRADPALLTCFDPADKELYDLWAPRR